ncbi:hypothetical protein GGI25_000170 [Coemansia spiralis]|uniref:Uncharacterized protein n=2 Tax=Coemansia TaxID=4863 RepID=A0A9W8G897_9FUNG|nr:hypothetical protein EDC05_002814 [Coemansia umbellata]KAJ2621828.1 hypothetical protein GGI26_003808 [Coemansia sp. RSA 1358]KAJ2681215.1 hypothetical protein GGI25_000170 [Coemansia spiralis]
MRCSIHPLILALLVLVAAVCSATKPHIRNPQSSASVSAGATSTATPGALSTSTNNDTELDEAMRRIFTMLVEHTFNPQTRGHADLYYKTRFFTAHMQARMHYIESQHELLIQDTANKINSTSGIADESESMGMSQAEAEDLNSIMREMWLASRKLYQNWGCLSYDLTLCNGQMSKGRRLTDSEKTAMVEWEKRLSTPFAATKLLSKDEAEEIHSLAKGILSVLLSADSAAPKPE